MDAENLWLTAAKTRYFNTFSPKEPLCPEQPCVMPSKKCLKREGKRQ
jgi:hypothetical protein